MGPGEESRPRSFMRLPDPVDAEAATFHRALTELIRLIGDHVPGTAPDDQADPAQQRRTIGRALDGRQQLPEALFDGLLRAAVYDPDPSFNRQFVEPAMAAYGRRRVQEALLRYLQTGTDQERAGAAHAWYWTRVRLVSVKRGHAWVLTPESKAEYDAYEDLRIRWKQAALREFVANDNLDVRRCILPGLPLNPAEYPQRLHELVAEAVHIARTHPDEYLRHRVEHQI